MPRKTINDYVFYKFVCNDENIKCCYVGSTANFSDRKRGHFHYCNNPNTKKHNYKLYETIRANGGWKNWNMVIIGEAKEISLTQSRILEQNYIDELEEKLNTNRAYRTKEDLAEDNKIAKKKQYEKNKEKIKANMKLYMEANKEQIKAYKEEYYEANKEQINKQARIYYEANKEQIKEQTKKWKEENKEKLKEWREANKERTKEYNKQYRLKKKEQNKQYRLKNKEQIKEQRKAYYLKKKEQKNV